jgi:hypothetical protein
VIWRFTYCSFTAQIIVYSFNKNLRIGCVKLWKLKEFSGKNVMKFSFLKCVGLLSSGSESVMINYLLTNLVLVDNVY